MAMKNNIVFTSLFDKPRISKLEYFMVFLMLVLSGFPASDIIPGKSYVLCFIGICILPHWWKLTGFRKLLILICMSLTVGIYHYVNFAYLERTISSFPILFFAGFVTCRYLGYKFRYAYLNLMYILSVVGLLFHLINCLGIHIDILNIPAYKSIFIYNYNINHGIRNCGPFWEPGAYAGYLNVVALLFFHDLRELWIHCKKKCVVLALALLSTLSTQGYLVLFFILALYLLNSSTKNNKYVIVFLPIFVVSSFFMYLSVPFLHNKIEQQYDRFLNWDDDESIRSADRAVTAMVDISNIKEYPLMGKTDSPSMLYSEFPVIMYRIDYLDGHYGSGSGTTTFMASYGILFFMLLIWLAYLNFYTFYGSKIALSMITIILVMGFGEQFFVYVLFLSFPFVEFKKI